MILFKAGKGPNRNNLGLAKDPEGQTRTTQRATWALEMQSPIYQTKHFGPTLMNIQSSIGLARPSSP